MAAGRHLDDAAVEVVAEEPGPPVELHEEDLGKEEVCVCVCVCVLCVVCVCVCVCERERERESE